MNHLITFKILILMKFSQVQTFLQFTSGLSVLFFAAYWMYMCCGEHWIEAVGPQNLIILLFVIVLTLIALIFYSKKKTKLYYISVLLSLIPGIIVCYINRAARYPDIDQLIARYNEVHKTDPIFTGYNAIYAVDFLRYEYITSRSSTSSFILFLLQMIWIVLISYRYLIPKKKNNVNSN